MKIRLVGSALLLVALVSMAVGAGATVPRVHAATTGLVCISGVDSDFCPSVLPAVSVTNGTQVQIAVNIQGSDSINGFDIFVKAEPSVLRGVSVDLTGSVLGSSILPVAECVDDHGFGCFAGQNGVGSVEVAAVALAFITAAPTTGRLFTITYDAIADSSNVLVDFQAGCTGTSVSPDICVTVVNAGVLVPEKSQGTSGNPGAIGVSVFLSPSTVSRGKSLFGEATFSSLNGFFGGMTISISISPVRRNGPTAFFLTSSTVNLEPGTSVTFLVMVNTLVMTPGGTYTLTVTGSSGTLSGSASTTFKVTGPFR